MVRFKLFSKNTRWLWVMIYVVYIVFILISATAYYAEQSINSRAVGEHNYMLTFENDGKKDHYTVKLDNPTEDGIIWVTYDGQTNHLDVVTKNIRELTIDCRSIAEEKSNEILGLDYEDNENYYKEYFIEKQRFTVAVRVDVEDMVLIFEDCPYPSSVVVNDETWVEGEDKDYTFVNINLKGQIETEVPIGQSAVTIYFRNDGRPNLEARFTTDNEFGFHLPNTNIKFDAGESIGDITDYIWDFGDGYYGSGEITNHNYRVGDDYDVTLIIRDSVGLVDRVKKTLPVKDEDDDGLPDAWEEKHFQGLTQEMNDDFDHDGLSNWNEFILKTEPNNKDTDGDTYTDGDEVNTHGTEPLDPDSKPPEDEEEKEDNGMFGLGKVAGIDLFLLLILIIVIIIIIALSIVIASGRKRKVETVEEEVVEKETVLEEKVEEEEEEEEKEEDEEEEEEYGCPECGAQIFEDQPTCNDCGANLEWEDEDEEDEEDEEASVAMEQPVAAVKPVAAAPAPIPEQVPEPVQKEEPIGEDEDIDEIEEFECPTCGAVVSEDDVICANCGEEFE